MPGLWYANDIPTNNELIFEEHIPIFFEEEVVTEECYVTEENENVVPSTNNSLNNDTKPKNNNLTLNRDLLKVNHQRDVSTTSQSRSRTPRTPQTPSSNFKPFVLNDHTMRIFKNKIKAIQKRRAQALAREKKQRPKKVKPVTTPTIQSNSNNKTPSVAPSVISRKRTASHHVVKKPEVVEYITYKPKPSVDPKNSGEILRMEKVESDDIEVDILSNSEDEDNTTNVVIGLSDLPEDDESGEMSVDDPDSSFTTEEVIPIVEQEDVQKLNELRDYDEETFLVIENTEIPTNELTFDTMNISSVEKFMMSEFFTGSPAKTPERYLKIRNHIIGMWNQYKPNYVSKTVCRNGLKKCGDVSAIGRVHLLLENLGVINFNCTEVKYILPLKILYGIFQQSIRNKNQSYMRNKNDLTSDNAVMIQHSSSSDTMVNRIKSRTQSRTQFELIKCQRYSKDNLAPFEISITLSCLLCLYFHALSSKLEIMGFLGGHVDKSNGRNKINLKCYKPCRTSIQTPISAEMCPISQVEQSSDLTESGYELLGWFHSHPSFPAIPSRTDLRTQNEIQMQFAPNNPFIGFILSCLQPMDFK